MHLIYLACDIDIVPRIGIGDTQNGIGSLGDAHGLWIADVRKRGLENTIVVEHMDAFVAAIARVDVALRVYRDTQNVGEFSGPCAFLAQDFTNRPSLSNFAMRALPAPSATGSGGKQARS
jgi:hypothetical protein